MVLTSKVIPEKLANDIINDLWSSITRTAKTVSLQGEEVCIAVNLQDLNVKLLGNASKGVLHVPYAKHKNRIDILLASILF